MPKKTISKASTGKSSRIVVAGDVCIDWLSVRVEPVAATDDAAMPMNWQLRDGRHMYARHGGAWLTLDFLRAAVDGGAEVLGPKREDKLENISPDEIIHSMLTLAPRPRQRDSEEVLIWAVDRTEGFAGPLRDKKTLIPRIEHTDGGRGANLVVIDDAGNGFRNDSGAWPANAFEANPLVLYKVRRPLGVGDLWKFLKAKHLSQAVVLLSADDLRGEGANISSRLSWERTATDLVLALAHDPHFLPLRSCCALIISLGIEGALLIECANAEVTSAQLWYRANLTEGELSSTERGDMVGFGSVFTATIAAALVKDSPPNNLKPAELRERLSKGIGEALHAMSCLLEHGFGPCEMSDKQDPPRKDWRDPAYPISDVYKAMRQCESDVCSVRLPTLPTDPDLIPNYQAWRILDAKRDSAFLTLAQKVAHKGLQAVFKDVPVATFGDLQTLDRREIESFRSVRNLIREFLAVSKPKHPLCLAVFGAPGSGKSFGVTEVAKSVAKDGQIEKIDFNLAQWDNPAYLAQALHRVRDYALRGKVPIAFFDEFDSKLGSEALGWLKYFLAPMQDGVFSDGMATHEIGKVIFVFAGGTASCLTDFAMPKNVSNDQLKAAKLPDFLSRLRGYVDILGFDPPLDTNLLRRALILNSTIARRYAALKDVAGRVRIDDGVLRALLQIPVFKHGIRSMEAILEMSSLSSRTHFDPSHLPSLNQLALHVNPAGFQSLLDHSRLLGENLEALAEAIHEVYFSAELRGLQGLPQAEYDKKVASSPALRPWADLAEIYKNSNREQAAYLPVLLNAAGYGLKKADKEPSFGFTNADIEKLAPLEHARWVEERRIKQPEHPSLKPWDELGSIEQMKDKRTIQAIPGLLKKLGIQIVELP